MKQLHRHRKALRLLAHRYAERPDIVQGGGGNMSVKINGGRMLIKASGFTFKDVAEGQGLVLVDRRVLKEWLVHTRARSEKKHNASALAAVCTDASQPLRPSMEIWFHILFKKYVLHTHSVFVNTFGCAYRGSHVLKRKLEEQHIRVLVLPYENPGFPLGRLLDRTLHLRGRWIPDIVILENHGIIVTSHTAERCIELHELTESVARTFLAQEGSVKPLEVGAWQRAWKTLSARHLFSHAVLFPDQTVYPDHPDIRAAHHSIMKQMQACAFRPRSLPKHKERLVRSLEAEQYRKKLIRS